MAAILSVPPPVAGVCGSQNGGLRGRVVDPAGAPVAAARVTLSFLGGVNRTVSFESDERGTFVRMGIRLGEYRLEVAKDGYRGHEETVRIRPGPPTRLGEIVLPPLRPAPGAPQSPAGSAELRAGQASLASGDPEAAAAAFREEIALRPGSADSHRLLGVALTRLGQAEEARAALWRAVELSPDSRPAWTALADLEAGLGRWPETIAALEAALALDPGADDLRFRLGGALLNAGELARAETAFTAVLEAEPGNAPAHYQLALIALNGGRNEEAVVHLERVLELAPEGPDAEPARGMLAVLRPGGGGVRPVST